MYTLPTNNMHQLSAALTIKIIMTINDENNNDNNDGNNNDNENDKLYP